MLTWKFEDCKNVQDKYQWKSCFNLNGISALIFMLCITRIDKQAMCCGPNNSYEVINGGKLKTFMNYDMLFSRTFSFILFLQARKSKQFMAFYLCNLRVKKTNSIAFLDKFNTNENNPLKQSCGRDISHQQKEH